MAYKKELIQMLREWIEAFGPCIDSCDPEDQGFECIICQTERLLLGNG